jgi:hypothetical protein
MLLYSWSKVLKEAQSKSDILIIMRMLTWPSQYYSGQHKKMNRWTAKDFDGFCFLLNPEELLNKPEGDDDAILEYLYLASRRNLGDYLLTKNKKLDCRLVNYVPTNNQLLTIQNNEISFAYE